MSTEQQGFLRGAPPAGASIGPLQIEPVTFNVSVEAASDFTNLLKFQPYDGEELRAEETSTDRYHGAAPDGTSTASAVWKVVRFEKNAAGDIVRVRFRENVAWDDRATGWT